MADLLASKIGFLHSDAVKLCIRAEHLRLSQDLLAE